MTLTREQMLSGAALALVQPRAALAMTKRRAVYRLDPVSGSCSKGRCACKACYRHAANKLFATAKAAQVHRAHKHCNCRVVTSSLPAHTWIDLFGSPRHPAHVVVDRRTPRVRAILAGAAKRL